MIPMTDRPLEENISKIKLSFNQSSTLKIEMSKLNDDYLSSPEAIIHTLKWIQNHQN